MKKSIFIAILLFATSFLAYSQSPAVHKSVKVTKKSKLIGNVTIGSSSFDGSAVLTVTSTTQGVLMPRMNTASRDAISSPTDGLLIFNTQTNLYEFFETTWQAVGTDGTGDSSFVTLQWDTAKAFNNTNIQFTDSTTFQEHLQADKSFEVNGNALILGEAKFASSGIANIGSPVANNLHGFSGVGTTLGGFEKAFWDLNSVSALMGFCFSSFNASENVIFVDITNVVGVNANRAWTVNNDGGTVEMSWFSTVPVIQQAQVTDLKDAFINYGLLSAVGGATPLDLDGGTLAAGKIGIGITVPATSAALDVSTTTGAILFPRMNTAARDNLTAVNGMVIYNTSLNKLQVRAASAWVSLH